MKIKRHEYPLFNYKAAIKPDLEKIERYVKLSNVKAKNATFKLEIDGLGWIVLIRDEEIIGLISNKHVSIFDSKEKDIILDSNDIAEALLYKIISEAIPTELVLDYLPTLLIFLELMGLNFDHMDFSLWDNKYNDNQFCLCSGLKIEDKGNLFAYDKDTKDYANDGKNKSKSFYTQFTAKSGSKIKGIKPGILLYREIIKHTDSLLSPHESRKYYLGVFNALKQYCENSVKFLESGLPVSQGYTPQDLNQMDKKYICNNLNELVNQGLVMIVGKDRPAMIIDYYSLLEKINTNRRSLEKRDLTLENYLVNINQMKNLISANLNSPSPN